ncbi:PDC2 [Cordylochernes scorpioides]|uniref:PDC2 n=1 Tax=Cordylochernes scorpioides TaxID=51811 RepID=A0ABY6LFQ5_9ARAC|nr:PDC2 [Cordylochernes scorpioides]
MKLAINGNILKEKAILLALKMGQYNFEASNGWLEKFKARRNIAFKRLHGEAGSVDANSVATWKGIKKHQAIDVNYIDFLEVDKDVQVAGEQSIEEIVKEVMGKEEDEETIARNDGVNMNRIASDLGKSRQRVQNIVKRDLGLQSSYRLYRGQTLFEAAI